jgi:GT2 family glycosyltransferase
MILSNSQPNIGIVTVNYNGKEYLIDFIKSIQKLTYRNFELCLIDNASTDSSIEEIARNYPDVTIIYHSKNVGIAAGNNIGINYFRKKSKVEYVLFLNPDTIHEPNFLCELEKLANSKILVVPRIYFFDQPQILNSTVGITDWWRGIVRASYRNLADSDQTRKIHEVGMASTCALLAPMNVFDQAGVMDEAYFMYYDDNDFILRASRQGFKILFNPNAVIYHKENSLKGRDSTPLAIYYGNRNRLYFMFKHQPSKLKLTFFLAYFFLGRCIYLVRYLLKGEIELNNAMVAAISDFFRGKMGYTPRCRWQKDNR